MEKSWDGVPVARERPYACCLREETGLELAPAQIQSPNPPEVALHVAEAPRDAKVALDEEHDAHRWLALEAVADLCRPATVVDGLRAASASLE
jgi:hypothetical protein